MRSSLLLFAGILLVAAQSCNSNNNNNGGATTDSMSASSSVTTTGANTVDTANSHAGDNMNAAANRATTAAEESMARNPDSSFVEDVIVANSNEMKVLQAGVDMGGKAVKEHGRMMLTDHKKLASEMDAYAKKHNYSVSPPDKDKPVKEVDDLKGKTGNDRDKEWVSFLYGEHEKTIGKFEGAQNHVKDAELKTMITNTLPTLHKHLDMLKKMQDEMK